MASAAWAKACRSRSHRTAAVLSGWRMRARRRISPLSTCRIRASPKWSCRPICRSPICAPTRSRSAATRWQWPISARRSARSRRASSFLIFPCPRNPSRSPSPIAAANFPAAYISFGSVTANTSTWPPAPRTSSRLIHSTTSSIAASTCATRRSPPRSDAGGCLARAKATMSRRRRAIRPRSSTRATARTTPTSIRSGRTGSTSPISMPACSSWTFPTSRGRSRSRASTIRRPIPASPTRCCRCSSATSSS